MKNSPTIGVHARELEAQRIDGTRVYMAAILKQWFALDRKIVQRTDLYHGSADFNSALEIPASYGEVKISNWPLWTQTAFARSVCTRAPDVLWMPLHNMPMIHRSRTRIVVTIHDLAFKKFPSHFPWKDRLLHNIQANYVVRHADHLIVVSESTKRDILSYYPFVDESKVTVVHHGIDSLEWTIQSGGEAFDKVADDFGIVKDYIVYVGALQPRKNLVRLIRAFEKLRDLGHECQLVLAGGDAWLSEDIHEAAKESVYSADIILTGGVSHEQKKILLKNAVLLAYPSLYEGFGLPILEAFGVQTPVVTADNSSLREIAADGAHYCEATDINSIAEALEEVFVDTSLRDTLVENGSKRIVDFSWERSARKTLEILDGV